MFNGARNIVVEGGSFVVNIDSSKKVDIDRLLLRVAPDAILNAGGRADEVGCFPGTRKEVIGRVERWMSRVRDGSCKNRIMWLSGPAGAGKSAICQTIAERCPARQQQAASFFFFRGDKTRNHAQPLVPTLVYQLRRFYPMLDELLTNYLMADPLICEASIRDQFPYLISFPMQRVQQSSSMHETVVIIVDGLDECDDTRQQEKIVIALRALVETDYSPFLVLIASRAEPHLVLSFNRLGTSMESLFLGDEYRPHDDIRRFVTAKFKEIKKNHHLRQMLPRNWPPAWYIDAVTDQSSGQFIYAATAMRFIEQSSESPDLSFITILDTQTTPSHNPLPQLDAVYSYIFSKVRDIQSVTLILCACLIADAQGERHDLIVQLLGYRPVEVKSLFADVGAVIRVDMDPLELVSYHTSLYDYLTDKRRSGDYYLDYEKFAPELFMRCLGDVHDQDSFRLATWFLDRVNKTTTELSTSLLDASKRVIRVAHTQISERQYTWCILMRQIERLYFETDKKMFKNLSSSRQ